MSNEEFRVEPEHVAGYSRLASLTASDSWMIGKYILDNASSDDNFGAVMDLLRGPVDGYAEACDNRTSDRGWTLNYTATSLEDTAWTYYRADGGAAERIDSGSGTLVEQDLPGTVHYDAKSNVRSALTPPDAPAEADVEALVEEYAGDTTQAIDGLCRFVSRLVADEWSPMEAIINPLIGNWNALKQKGEALVIAGEAAETAASNLTTSLSTLDTHWDGGAAQSFTDYLTKLAAALDYEGALARVVSRVYEGIAWVVEWIAIGAVRAISRAVEIIRRYMPGGGLASRVVDVVGDILGRHNPIDTLRDDWNMAWAFFEDALAMIEILRELPGQIEEILGMVSDPMGALTEHTEGELQELLEPLREAVSAPEVEVDLEEAPENLFEFGEDLAEVANTDTVTEAPAEAYDAGADPRRAGT